MASSHNAVAERGHPEAPWWRWWDRLPPAVSDGLVAVATTAVALALLAIADEPDRWAPDALGYVLLIAAGAPLTLRRGRRRRLPRAPAPADRRGRMMAGGGEGAVRVLLADDQHLVRAGFRLVLERDERIEMVGEGADGAEAVDLALRLRPDVVLMDVRMPLLDGLEATRRVLEDDRADRVRVLVLTTFELDDYVFDALRAGASGFLRKDIEPEQLRRAVHVVAAGQALLSPTVTARVTAEFSARRDPRPKDPARLGLLTDREREVLALVAEGLSNDQIGKRLFMSPATAKDARQPRDDQAARQGSRPTGRDRLRDRTGRPCLIVCGRRRTAPDGYFR